MIHLRAKMPDARSGFDLLLDTPFNEIVIVAHLGLESDPNFRWHYSNVIGYTSHLFFLLFLLMLPLPVVQSLRKCRHLSY